jgi:S1-C subfamily serine protease
MRLTRVQKTCAFPGRASTLIPSVRIGLALTVLIVACGGASTAPPPVAASRAGAGAASPPAASLPAPRPPASGEPYRLVRSSVKGVVSQGLGAFLQLVELDDQPAVVDGKFRGFRIAALHGTRFWSGVDLKVGDVVTSVNGLPIERPEQALAAFDSIVAASELRVAYDRDGQARELVYKIVDSL